jgi:HK97 family phage major capsid protein
MNLHDINDRLVELRSQVDSEGADLESIETEINNLLEEKRTLTEKAEKRQALIQKALVEETQPIEQFEERKEDKPLENLLATKEYRSAYFKKMAGESLNEAEERAFTSTTANFAGALPVETARMIWSNIEEQHPILGDITLYRTGTVFELTTHNAIAAGDAAVVNQGVANADEENTFVKVSLSGKDFSKHVEVSYALGKMNGQALEDYLVGEIADRIGAALASDVVAQIIADTHADNKKTSAAVKVTTFVELNGLFALLKQAKGKVVYCNEFSLYTYLTSIVDTTGRPIFQPNAQSDIAGFLLGAPVKIEDSVADNVFVIGAPKKVVGNMVQDIMIEQDKDIKRHVDIYAGYARFQCKLTFNKSFVIFTLKQS